MMTSESRSRRIPCSLVVRLHRTNERSDRSADEETFQRLRRHVWAHRLDSFSVNVLGPQQPKTDWDIRIGCLSILRTLPWQDGSGSSGPTEARQDSFLEFWQKMWVWFIQKYCTHRIVGTSGAVCCGIRKMLDAGTVLRQHSITENPSNSAVWESLHVFNKH